MRLIYLAFSGLAMLAAGSAVAQSPPDAPPRPGMDGGPRDMREGGWMRHRMMEGRGARFEFSRGDAHVDVKCAANEPMKACVEAATALLDKLAPAAK